MALKIVWSEKAIKDQRSIANYWLKRKKSASYSKKLVLLFEYCLQRASEPYSFGHKTSRANTFYLIALDYKIFYRITATELRVLRIWDGRRNPSKQPYK